MLLSERNSVLIILLFISFVSCDRPQCYNTNGIFANNNPEDIVYKVELEKHIEAIRPENLRYWLKSYVEKDSQEYLLINVQNDSLCAIMKLSVNAWGRKIKHIKDRKGVGRRGAELDGLTFTVIKNQNDISFIYQSLDRIID